MMSELRKRRKSLEGRAEKTVGGSSDSWLRQFLIQQFLIQTVNTELAHGRKTGQVSHSEVEEMWDAGLIERVEGLEGSMLLFAEDWTLETARAALRVRKNLK
jgi:hypothetical protein